MSTTKCSRKFGEGNWLCMTLILPNAHTLRLKKERKKSCEDELASSELRDYVYMYVSTMEYVIERWGKSGFEPKT